MHLEVRTRSGHDGLNPLMKYIQLGYRSRMVAIGVHHVKDLNKCQGIHCNNTKVMGVVMKDSGGLEPRAG